MHIPERVWICILEISSAQAVLLQLESTTICRHGTECRWRGCWLSPRLCNGCGQLTPQVVGPTQGETATSAHSFDFGRGTF